VATFFRAGGKSDGITAFLLESGLIVGRSHSRKHVIGRIGAGRSLGAQCHLGRWNVDVTNGMRRHSNHLAYISQLRHDARDDVILVETVHEGLSEVIPKRGNGALIENERKYGGVLWVARVDDNPLRNGDLEIVLSSGLLNQGTNLGQERLSNLVGDEEDMAESWVVE
jgi:hypothetical protein